MATTSNFRKRHPGWTKLYDPVPIPAGRHQWRIYAVVLREHPGVVKIGRTTQWHKRRKTYANWNLQHDAILHERVFTINEEYPDLELLERQLISTLPFPKRHGNEWFEGNFEAICRFIERLLFSHGLLFDVGGTPLDR